MKFTRITSSSAVRVSIVFALAAALFSGMPTSAHAVADGTVNCGTSGTFTIVSNVVTGHSSCVGTVAIPEGVTGIASNSFIYAEVTTMTIPASVTTITSHPFNCSAGSLLSITVDPTNPNYSSTGGVLFDKLQTEILVYPASKSGALYAIPSTVLALRSCSFAANKFLTSMALPDTLQTLGATAFVDAESLQTVTVGTGLSSWGAQSFTRNRALVSFTIDPSNASFTSTDGIAYNKNKTTIVAYPIGKVSTSYTSPTSATTTEQALFVDSVNLLTANLSSVANLEAQAFMGSAIKEVTLGNSLSSIPVQTFQNAMELERVTFGTGLTSIDPNGFFNNFKLNCIVYPGSNATIQNFVYPNSVVPVANSSLCPKSPDFTLSTSTVTGTIGTAITSYTIDASAGGTIASYSISPAISNTPGISFSTSTGLITGTPTDVAASRTYTITATNALGTATRDFAITVTAPAPVVVYVAPTPIPYLKTITTPKLNLKDGKLMCTPGTYNSGYTLDGVVRGSISALFSPSSYTYNLLINGVAQTSLAVTTATSTATWNTSTLTLGSLLTCSVTVSANSLTNTDKSSDNTSAVSSALTTQSTTIAVANNDYSASLSANSKVYQKALVDNRATWRKEITAIRSNYYDTLIRIKSNGGSKMIADTSTALKIMIAAQKKSAADYAVSKPAALVAKDAANRAALDAKNEAIAKANATYGTFIESIGFGVLMPEEVTQGADSGSVEVAKPTPTPTPTPKPTPTPTPTPTPSPTATNNTQPTLQMSKVGTVYMATGSYQLSLDVKKQLVALAKAINSSSAKTILVYGHTDIRSGVNNTVLSQKRAKAVSAYLRPLLKIKKISIGWYASRKPAATGSTSADLALNRRVEIYTK